jgi:hypothetical protein
MVGTHAAGLRFFADAPAAWASMVPRPSFVTWFAYQLPPTSGDAFPSRTPPIELRSGDKEATAKHAFGVTPSVRGCRVYGCRPGCSGRFRDGSELHCV